MIRVLLYLLSIVTANVVTARFMPIEIGIFIIPFGSFFIGTTFILRDLVQNKYGRKKTYAFIFLALVLSAIVSYLLGDTLVIVAASAFSFLVSESSDTEIYTRLKLPMAWRVFYSGIAGGLLDSVIFVVVGLSPLGAGFVPWAAVPAAIVGQVIVKIVMQMIGAIILARGLVYKEKRLSKMSV